MSGEEEKFVLLARLNLRGKVFTAIPILLLFI
jgi:hypothetical protein